MNYINYYGLRRNPFLNTKISDVYVTDDMVELNHRLKYLQQVKGIGVIYGKHGTGKSFSIRCFIDTLHKPTHRIVYISQTAVSLFEIYKQIAMALNIPIVCSKIDLFKAIQDKIKALNTGKQIVTVLIFDEAHRLSKEVIDNLELLLNWDIDASRYCLLILSGTKDLINNIPDSFADRIMMNYNTIGIKANEVEKYIQHMFKIAGCKTNKCERLFNKSAINALSQCCDNNIRKLNMLIDKCLFFGHQQGVEEINKELVMLVFNEITLK